MVTKKRSKIGWKQASEDKDGGKWGRKVLIKLRIDGPVVRPKSDDGKARTSMVKVLEIRPIYQRDLSWDGKTGGRKVGSRKISVAWSSGFHGIRDAKPFKYEVGKISYAGLDRRVGRECGRGINFFFSKTKAINYH